MSEVKIPEGYKQTEVGVIPSDWEVVSLNDVASFGGGTTPPRKLYERYYARGTYPWVKTLDLNNSFIWNTEEHLTELTYTEISLKRHPIGTVLVAMYGGFNQIGRTGLLKVEASMNQALVAVIPKKEKLVSEYLLYNLNFNVDYWKEVASSSRKDPNITSNDIKSYLLAIPFKSEQTAIATALSDVDNLIQSLEKLIAKKEAIKTGTMQQLLTGKTRLPEFATREDGNPKGFKQTELGRIPKDWEVINFDELLEPTISKKPIKPSTLVTFIGMQDVTGNAQLANQTVVSYEKVKNGFTYFENGDVLLAKITPCFENGKGCHTETLKTKYGFGSTEFHVLRATEYSDSKFIYFWTTRNSFRIDLESTMVGSAGHRRVPLSAVKSYQIPCPTSKSEQTAIATILSDMDAEIQTLQQRLEKTKDIKQGMMQQLLTGKVRLAH